MSSRVLTFVGESRREREVFDGLDEDAREFIRLSFPRLHIEPGTHYGDDGPPADAVLVAEDGSRQFFDGKNWQDWHPPNSAAVRTNQPDDRDAEIARLQAELEQARRDNSGGSPQTQTPPNLAGLDIQDAAE